jgi:heptosyltransferase-2
MGGKSLENILIIQTAFLGDVILATSIVEKIYHHFPDSNIDFVLKKGYESLFDGHPGINHIFAFDKGSRKYRNLYRLLKDLRKKKYDLVINIQRYATTGLITVFSRSLIKVGFNKNPLSYFFDKKVRHSFDGLHEIERNHKLIEWFTDDEPVHPKLYPSQQNYQNIAEFGKNPYICIAPASVWFTKQFPEERWIELISQINKKCNILLIGGPEDSELCERIQGKARRDTMNLCGKINLLDSAALMENAVINLVNDSAPMHIASAMNAPVAVFYCSTVPLFGYGPLSDDARIIQVEESLSCRPCGDHGAQSCPEKHFDCAHKIDFSVMLKDINARLEAIT